VLADNEVGGPPDVDPRVPASSRSIFGANSITSFVLGDFRIDQLAATAAQPRQGAGLVRSHQTAVAGDIGRQDGCKPALDPLIGQRFLPAW
jgi:hypothetical protein